MGAGGSKGTNMPVRRPGLFREDLSTSGEFLLDSPLQDCEFREVRLAGISPLDLVPAQGRCSMKSG